MTDKLEPTQADRDAASKFVRQAWHLFWPNNYARAMQDADDIAAGRNDNWLIVESFARHRTAHSGEGRANDKPPHHWAADDKCDRHPQSAEEWNWRADKPDATASSIKRLHFAVDRGDPHAPDQMATVLRVDLSRVLGRLTHYTAHREMLMKQRVSGEGRSYGTGEDKQLVPREPTEEMYLAAFNSDHWGGKVPIRRVVDEIWTAMLRAALAPQGDGEIEGKRAKGVPVSDWSWWVGSEDNVVGEGLYDLYEAGRREDAISWAECHINPGERFFLIEARTRALSDDMEFMPFVAKRNATAFMIDDAGNAVEIPAALQRDTGGEHG